MKVLYGNVANHDVGFLAFWLSGYKTLKQKSSAVRRQRIQQMYPTKQKQMNQKFFGNDTALPGSVTLCIGPTRANDKSCGPKRANDMSCCAAGTHVRSAATLGGNIALGRLRALESDVITVFMAAGASIQVVSKKTSR